MNIQWNAGDYTRNFSFVHEYGGDLIGLLPAGGRVLDLGCGNGALTKKLADAGFRAFGLDASQSLLETARASYPELTFLDGDAVNFALDEPVDAVFSNAVFHWIDESRQQDMLDCVFRAMKPGGAFVFEFGGSGNCARIHAGLRRAFERRGLDYRMGFYFPSVGQYAPMLERAGFRVELAMLFDRMTELKGQNGLADWMRMFIRTPFGAMSEARRQEIIAEAAEALRDQLYWDGAWHADYVRIRFKAAKREESSWR